jgi:hypothetical protein
MALRLAERKYRQRPNLNAYKPEPDKRFNPSDVVGYFFEDKVSRLFNIEWADVAALGHVPDLVSKDRLFFVEVKSSSYNNGGVINMGQLRRFERNIMVRRFYAFPFHPLKVGEARRFPTEAALRRALSLKSLYLFPFSVAKAHFETSRKVRPKRHDVYVQLRESLARKIFEKDPEAWEKLGLDKDQYKAVSPHEKIHIMTRNGYLEQQLLDSFNAKEI